MTDHDDYWLQLAADLRTAADRIATLAGTGKPEFAASLYLAGSVVAASADKAVPIVDAVAAAFGATAQTRFEGRGSMRRGEHRVATTHGSLRVVSYATVPVPPTRRQRMADLEAENEALRAQLAEGGAR